jgi:hypothetical protein
MDVSIKKSQFVDGRYSLDYGVNKRATFVVVNESFQGNNNLGIVNRVNIFIESFDNESNKLSGSFSTSIIGVGDGITGILTEVTSLLGKTLSWDNIEQCVIRLYE